MMSNPKHSDACHCECDVLASVVMQFIKQSDYYAKEFKLINLMDNYQTHITVRNVLLACLDAAGYNSIDVGEWIV